MKDLTVVNNLNREKTLGDPVQYQYIYEVDKDQRLILLIENKSPHIAVSVSAGKGIYLSDSMINDIRHISEIKVLRIPSDVVLSEIEMPQLNYATFTVTEGPPLR